MRNERRVRQRERQERLHRGVNYSIGEESATNNKFDVESITNDKIEEESVRRERIDEDAVKKTVQRVSADPEESIR